MILDCKKCSCESLSLNTNNLSFTEPKDKFIKGIGKDAKLLYLLEAIKQKTLKYFLCP